MSKLFQEDTPTREEALNQVISSIAEEEFGLGHVIKSEGDKLQYALHATGLTPPSIDELLSINESIQKTLDSAALSQFFLRDKLQSALDAPTMVGPTGPTGPTATTVYAQLYR